METIASKQNNQIKQLCQLAQKKYRQETGFFTVENLTIIYDALKSGQQFHSLFMTQGFIDKHQEKFDYLHNQAITQNIYLISDEVDKHCSQLDTSPGIIATYQMKKSKIASNETVVYLDGISDPGNLGTIMRTCLALGFNNLVLSANCVDVYNAKTISAAKDSIFKLNVISDIEGKWIRDCKLPIYCADSNEGISLDEFTPADKFCLVLGSESHGVSKEILKMAKKNLRIDIDKNIESLNVATAAAILLYKLSRK